MDILQLNKTSNAIFEVYSPITSPQLFPSRVWVCFRGCASLRCRFLQKSKAPWENLFFVARIGTFGSVYD